MLTVISCTVIVLLAAPVYAHYPWISVNNEDNGTGSFRIHFGHAFPEDGQLDADRLAGVRIVHPDGTAQTFDLEVGDHHPLPKMTEARGLIVAEQEPSYWSRTHEGGRPASREQYPDAFSCSQSGNVMKATSGDGSGQAWQHRQGHVLEILPLNDPADLHKGEALNVQVRFHGEPWQGELRATHADYSGEPEAPYAKTLESDADGKARLVLETAGDWLIRAHASEDYPNPEVCDRRSYYSTLTFTVR